MNNKEKKILLNAYETTLVANNEELECYTRAILLSLGLEEEVRLAKNKYILINLPECNREYIENAFISIENIFEKYDVRIDYELNDIQSKYDFAVEYMATEDEKAIIENELKKIKSYTLALG